MASRNPNHPQFRGRVKRQVEAHFGVTPMKAAALRDMILNAYPERRDLYRLSCSANVKKAKWRVLFAFAEDLPPAPPSKTALERRERKKAAKVNAPDFLSSYAWRRLRMEVLTERGTTCECCGASPQKHGTRVNVDHVKPRRLYPELALEKSNLQVLCEDCNHGKGNWDETDWRGPGVAVPGDA